MDRRPRWRGRFLSQRQLIGHLSDPLYRTGYLLTGGGMISSFLGLGFWVLAARLYPAHVVGRNSASIAAMMFVASVCQLGLPAVFVRDLRASGEKTRGLIVRSYALIFVSALALGAVAALTSGLWSSSLSFLGHRLGWTIGFALASAFFSIFQTQDYVMTGLEAPIWVPIENTLYSLVRLVVLAAIVGVAPAAGPFISWNVPAVAAVLLITGLIFGRLIAARPRRDSVAFSARRFIRMAAANQLALVFTFVVTLLMPVIVASATNATTSAYFYVPWTIANGIQLFAFSNALSLTGEGAGDPAALAALTRRSLVQSLRITTPLALVALVVAPWGLRLFGAGYAHHGTGLLRLLAVGAIANAVYQIGEALLRIQHRPVALVLTQGGQAAMFLTLSLLLLGSRGIDGVGLAFVVSQVVFAVGLAMTTIRRQLYAPPAAASSASIRS